VYNAAGFLSKSLPRLLDQTFDDIEIVLVDDCSTDDSARVCEDFGKDRSNVIVVRQPVNGGAAGARQRGVQECSGAYVWFVDADDDWTDNAIEVMVGAATAADVDVLVAGARIVRADGTGHRSIPAPAGEPVAAAAAFRMLLTGKLTGHLWNKLFRRSLLCQIDYVAAPVHSDLAMVADAISRAGRIGFSPETVYDYRLRVGGSIISSGSSRAASLQVVNDAVLRAADRVSPEMVDSEEYRYFYNRYILLSGIKDGVLGPYSPAESATIVASLRGQLSPKELLVFAKRHDARRLLLGVAAKTSVPAYRMLLSLADR